MYTDDDKPEMTMSKQIDVKATKPQNKHRQGRTWKCPIAAISIQVNMTLLFSHCGMVYQDREPIIIKGQGFSFSTTKFLY